MTDDGVPHGPPHPSLAEELTRRLREEVQRAASELEHDLARLRQDLLQTGATIDARLRRAAEELRAPAPVVEPPAPPPTHPPAAPEPLSVAAAPALPVHVARAERTTLRRAAAVLAWAIAAVAVVVVVAVSVAPRVLPYETLWVRSASMAPRIPKGSLLVAVEREASDLGVGDVITFDRPDGDGTVTHRIVALETAAGRRVFVTQGDANVGPDRWRVPAEGTLLERSFHVPAAGAAFHAIGTPIGRVVLLIASAFLLLGVGRRR